MIIIYEAFSYFVTFNNYPTDIIQSNQIVESKDDRQKLIHNANGYNQQKVL